MGLVVAGTFTERDGLDQRTDDVGSMTGGGCLRRLSSTLTFPLNAILNLELVRHVERLLD